jgi:hypothetical protein
MESNSVRGHIQGITDLLHRLSFG